VRRGAHAPAELFFAAPRPARHAVALLTRALAVILMSHLGRPDGKPNPSMTLKPVAERSAALTLTSTPPMLSSSLRWRCRGTSAPQHLICTPCAGRLGELMKKPVTFLEGCVGANPDADPDPNPNP
jgi:hypothetical protein